MLQTRAQKWEVLGLLCEKLPVTLAERLHWPNRSPLRRAEGMFQKGRDETAEVRFRRVRRRGEQLQKVGSV